MNTQTLNFDSKRMVTTLINLSAVALILAAASSLIKSPPIIAQEIRIAQNSVLSPIIAESKAKEDIETLSTDFDTSVRKRYGNGLIYNVAPGIKHIKLTKTYQGRPVRINVVEVNQKLNSKIAITPQLSSSRLASKSTITSIAKKTNSIVAINGTYFKPQTGVPLGTLMIDKKLYTGPIYNRVAMGIFDNGFDMARIELNAKLKTNKGEIKIDNVNQPRMLSTHVIAYSPEWGDFAPPTPKYGIQMAVENGKITSISTQKLPIPQNGYVIVGPKEKLKTAFQARKASIEIKTIPNWDNVNHIISGGPYLVKNGEIFIDMTEQKLGAIGGKNPRTAIGYTAEGNFVMAVIDGREGASVGMTLRELAGFLKSIGCVNAMNLDGGGSTVMYVNGKVVNMPAVKGGIALSNALTIELKS